ncbi:multidrug effflux MFS transporter [Suttonella sp. R2A3]|uniref:multidrug effflux MFS transporter n=1 Tax=Suttonella sp. R2A3 TaxID=2908648 RepID=UPI001F3B059E|nr:multidrug effflux MFS transporter [Suttonella sp. R2A3]UJF23718.1 multidrug effflux MFS transporter [Suttonella sp. R2A3]
MNPFFTSRRFILFIALMISLAALGIDAVLPAFEQMTDAFGLSAAEENRIQQVIFSFMLGLALFQLPFGIFADIYGRKIMLCIGVGIYILASFSVLFIDSFSGLLIARFAQGAGLASARVLSLTIVRDVSSGREMSRIMSFVMMVFIFVPILAPSIGQLVMLQGSWHSVFWLFIIMGSIMITWTLLELPETITPEQRSRFDAKHILASIRACLTHVPTLIYLAMLGLLFTMLMVYISQSEQIFQRDVYGLGKWFPVVFGVTASGMILASWTNSRLVMRVGMHKMVVFALTGMLLNDVVLLLCAFSGGGIMPLPLFVALLMGHMFFYGIAMPNLNSLILEPHFKIAGTASALVGMVMTIVGVALAHAISGQFNGTLYPLTLGYASISLVIFILNIMVNRYTAR